DLHGNVLALRSRKNLSLNPDLSRNFEVQVVHLAGLIRNQRTPRVLTGVMSLPDWPMLAAAAPVLPSNGNGAPRGVLLCGRKLDGDELAILSKTSGVSLTAFSPATSSPQLQTIALDLPSVTLSHSTDKASPELQALLPSEVPVLIRPLDEQTMAGYFRLFDLEGRPSVILNTLEV